MKRLKIVVFLLLLTFSLYACSKPDAKDVPVNDVVNSLLKNADIDSPQILDLTRQENAERFMLATSDFSEGLAVYSGNNQKADKIILVKANDVEKVQDVERALSSVLIGLTSSWEEDEIEAKKVETHVFKTKDTYVLLYIGQKTEQAEEIFDTLLSK